MPTDDVLRALELELMALIRRSRATTRDLSRMVHPRMDPTAYPLVATLALGPPRRVSELATLLSLDKSTVSRQIDAVSRLGLVERLPDPDDARARLVSLTESGQAIVTEQLAQRRTKMREIMRTWDIEDIAELARLLRKLGETGLF